MRFAESARASARITEGPFAVRVVGVRRRWARENSRREADEAEIQLRSHGFIFLDSQVCRIARESSLRPRRAGNYASSDLPRAAHPGEILGRGKPPG